ncbi:MAG TPA: hypothetical protein VF167_09545 [Longimicrobiaceae bacterium]
MASTPDVMPYLLPALRDATNDPHLRGAALTVYTWLVTNHLDTQEMRSVKVSGLSLTLRMKRHTVSRSLRTLCHRGYLERRYVAQQGYVYRAYAVRRADLDERRAS